ncbi:MAG: chloride channel protein, partial [Bacteroidales bacterium]|nr:chloride channel protein [Bacteroidales bacterium]
MLKTIWIRIKQLPESTLLLVLALIIGLISGLAAVLLKLSIEFIKEIFTNHGSLQIESLTYFLLPGAGMFLSLLFVKFLIKDNISHGVTRVLESISGNKSRIKSHNCYSSVVS